MEIQRPSLHIDHMLRTTRIHHAQLSSMADFKANVMITLGSLIITFSLGYIDDPVLKWPVITLIIFCLGTVGSAAYAVMPKPHSRTSPDPSSTNFNPLFFGSFMGMTYQEYIDYMSEQLDDTNRVYELQLREVYFLGRFLGEIKYRYVRYSYLLFLTGLVASATVFVVSEIVFLTSS